MKVLIVEPGKSPYEAEIEGGLEAMQAIVGGNIEVTYPFEDPVGLICNEEGKFEGLPLNRALFLEDGRPYDIIAGTFFVAGLDEEDFADLPQDLMDKYMERFRDPEVFIRSGDRILAIRQEAQEAVDEECEEELEPE